MSDLENYSSENEISEETEKKTKPRQKKAAGSGFDFAAILGNLKDILVSPIAGLRNYISGSNILVSGVLFLVQCLLSGWFALRVFKGMLGDLAEYTGGFGPKLFFTYFFILLVTNIANILAFNLVSVIRKNEKSILNCVDMAAVKLVVTIPLTLIGIILGYISFKAALAILLIIVGVCVAYDAAAVVGTSKVKSKLPIDVSIIWAISIIVFFIMASLLSGSMDAISIL